MVGEYHLHCNGLSDWSVIHVASYIATWINVYTKKVVTKLPYLPEYKSHIETRFDLSFS